MLPYLSNSLVLNKLNMELPNQSTSNVSGKENLTEVPENLRLVLLVLVACTIIFFILLSFVQPIRLTKPELVSAAGAAALPQGPFKDIQLIGKSAIVIDIQSGKTLFALRPNVQLPLASLTKVPLALVVAEAMPTDSRVEVPHDLPQIRSFGTLSAGASWPLKDVIDFTLVTSSNEGAELLAKAARGAVREKFSGAPIEQPVLWRMNELAHVLGLTQTYFLNVSGLDMSETLAGAYGSAHDMATLFAHANKSNFSGFSGTARGNVLLTPEYGGTQTVAYNTNDAEAEISGLIMGKTGFTDLAGGNLAVIFDVGLARPVVAVVLGSTEEGRFEDMRKLVEATRATIAAQ